MPATAFSKNHQFVEDKNHGVHKLNADQLSVVFLAAANAPGAANSVLADVTPIDLSNCSSLDLVVSESGQTGGDYKLVIDDLEIFAAGGNVGPFRYVQVYNNTPAAPADPLIGWLTYPEDVTINDGESIILDFNQVAGAITDS